MDDEVVQEKGSNDEIKKEEAVEGLEEKINKIQAELEEWKDKYIRLLAEFENFKKRQEKLQRESFESFADILLCGFLDIFDDLERALGAGSNDESFRKGVELIYKKMKDFIASYGVQEVSCKGEKFDPLVHDALSVYESNDDSMDGIIVDVLQKGYRRGNRVIRPPKVIVGVKKKDENKEDKER